MIYFRSNSSEKGKISSKKRPKGIKTAEDAESAEGGTVKKLTGLPAGQASPLTLQRPSLSRPRPAADLTPHSQWVRREVLPHVVWASLFLALSYAQGLIPGDSGRKCSVRLILIAD